MSQQGDMTGKELVFSALRHEPTPTTPWVPFAGVHAGKLKSYTAKEVLSSGEKLLASLLAVNELYAPDGQPVMFDLQLEAEILGCALHWADDAPPSVVSNPLGSDMTIPNKLPQPSDGRLPMVLDTMRALKAAVGDHTALYGLVCGPLTLASHLRGTEFFMDMYDHPEFVQELLDYCRDVAWRVAEMYIDAGMDVIAYVDPLVSQIAPRHFKSLLHEPYSDLFSKTRAAGVFSSFFVCGDATKNIEVMCETAPDSISIDENIDLPAAKEITDRYNITIGGNIPLTTTMLLGNQQDNMKFVVDLMDKIEPQNMILAPGCDMPYDTPIENTIAVGHAIRDLEGTRAMLANYHATSFDFDVELPDYGNLARPLMEVFTLDSATCPACGYMLEAAKRAHEEMGGKIDMVEYKFTVPENVARVKKMGVQYLPSIYLNGELKYSSIIPSNRELIEAIESVLS